ncbi:MAG: PKD domain-containing protein [Thermoplasmatota archaeon]
MATVRAASTAPSQAWPQLPAGVPAHPYGWQGALANGTGGNGTGSGSGGNGSSNGTQIANGGFETGNFQNWSVFANGCCEQGWFTYSGQRSPLTGINIHPPPRGNYAATTDEWGPSTMVLSQTFTVPTNPNATLEFIVYYQNWNGQFYNPNNLSWMGAPNQQYRVDLMTANATPEDMRASDIVANVFHTAPGDPAFLQPTLVKFSLAAYAGQTLQLRFANVDNEFYFEASVDDVRITTSPDPPCSAPSIGITNTFTQDLFVSISGTTSPGTTGECWINTINWAWGDGQTQTTFFPAYHEYSAPGTYNVTATAAQNDGQTATASAQVTVICGAPYLYTYGNQTGITGIPYALYGFAYPGQGCSIRGYSINWGDNSTANTSFLPGEHVYRLPGIYEIRTSAFQNDGQIARSNFTVFVRGPDLDMVGLTYQKAALSTDYTPSVVVPTGRWTITATVLNNEAFPECAPVNISVTPEEYGSAQTTNAFGCFPPHSVGTVTANYDPIGTLGDVQITAKVVVLGDPTPNNNAMSEEAFVIIGGLNNALP